jgi:hypothetical protein
MRVMTDSWVRAAIMRKTGAHIQRQHASQEPGPAPVTGKGIDEIAMGVFLKALKRYGVSCRIPNQAFQLVTSMGWHLGVGM